ncbi:MULTISPECIES: RNA polymerase sigma factor [Hymenobacter]|uniref:RNA polymerase sigma-70 factor n=1 Tax=Hymenobacter profundi TaxID=1982110 RepID=A0ABS6WZY8_9BACT|nr:MULTISPECIES: RNA polymerase sigma-70 factor [Hymenobacter]MBW3128323.1 RNA polymerase sigma-70 factor [Hymenobacter profundi]QNE39040.1 RNA polymerase sigma-70 factor [Hymenobacter sp. NBH84]
MTPKSHAISDDAALVQALSDGDARAFAEIYERYWWQLFSTAQRKLGSREAAEELVQDLFTALWQKRASSQIEKLPHYLNKALQYRIIDYLRVRTTHAGYLSYRQAQPLALDRSTEEVVAADDLSVALAESITQLPESTREVFRLSRLEHQSVAEIADQLHLSPKTVEYHLTRALKLLRVRLKDFLTLLLFFWLIK